jgi:FkbM family methyltransferase
MPCETLDDWMVDKKLTRIDVFKIDIEGTEPLMLRGTEIATRYHGRIQTLLGGASWCIYQD